MDLMQAPISRVNIYDINYPCYVAGIPVDSTRIVNIPGVYEYRNLESIFAYVVEAYKTKDKLYIADAMLTSLWYKKVCNIPFEKRIKTVRELTFEVVAKPEEVVDLDYVLIYNPAELNDYFDNLLTYGHTKARIMDVNGYYVFGIANEGEYYEVGL